MSMLNELWRQRQDALLLNDREMSQTLAYKWMALSRRAGT